MSLNINTVRQSGFTIVELLIVVVVIAILAAITIVSYNGITAQANTSAAQSTASTLIKKAELYASAEGNYPATLSALTASGNEDKSWFVPAGTATLADPNTEVGLEGLSSRTPQHVAFLPCPLSGTQTGVQVFYYDYQNGDAVRMTTGVGC